MTDIILLIPFLVGLYLPGYFSRKLLLNTARFDRVQSIVIDLGLGVSILTILGLVLNYSVGINDLSVIVIYAIYLGLVFLFYQRKRNHKSVKPNINLRNTLSRQSVFFWIFITFAIFVIVGIKFVWVSRFVSLPGDDQYFYMTITNGIVNQHTLRLNYQEVTLDGVGLPIVSAMFLLVFGTGILPYYTTIPIAFVAFASFSVYVFIREYVGTGEAIVSAILYGAIALPTYYSLWDGTYTVFLAEFFLVLGYYFLLRTFKQKNFVSAFVASLFLIQVVIFNVIVSAIMVITLPILLLGFLLVDSIRNRRPTVSFLKLKLVLTILAILIAAAIVLVLFSFLLQYASAILSVLLRRTSASSAIGTPSPPLSLALYPSYLGYAFTVLTVLGLLAAVVSFVRRTSALEKWPILVIFVWTVVCFGLSITSLSVSPDRFTRELDVPLSLSSGYIFYYFRKLIVL